MTTGLSASTIATVKATRPLLVEHGTAITTRFYDRLFARRADLRALFATTEPGQNARLAQALLAYVDHLDDLEALLPAVERIATKHVGAGVHPEHYPVVGEELLGAMADVLGPLDIEIVEAWAEAYGVLAEVFISVENEMAVEAAS